MSGTGTAPAVQQLYAEVKALLDRNELAAAIDVAESALAEGRDLRDAVYALSAACFRRGLIGTAIQLVRDQVNAGDVVPDSHEVLSILHCLAGQLSSALYHGKEASVVTKDGRMIALYGPDFPDFTTALAHVVQKPLMRQGIALAERGELASAIIHFEQHLLLEPNDVEAIDHYAVALMQDGQSAKALGMLRSLVTLGGLKPTLLSRIGSCLISMGRQEQGLGNHHLALAEAPHSIALWGSLVADLAYVPPGRSDAVALTAAWAACIDAKAVKSPRAAPALAAGDKHVLAILCSGPMAPIEREMLQYLVAGLDKSHFTTLGLGSGDLSLPHNVPFRGLFDRWRSVSELDVLTLGALIRGEGVAVLLDADGLRQPGRAGLFLRNCASIQAAWLNAPRHGPVPGANAHLVATPSELPGALVVPGGRYLLDVGGISSGALPSAQADAGFTFGADATMAELNAVTVGLWARVLVAVPGSMLLLRDRGQFADQDNVAALIDLFGNFGVAHRVDVVRADIAEFVAQVDVVLAPAPHLAVLDHGRMLRAGVPVVVLEGGAVVSDLVAAVQGTPQSHRLTAQDELGYVENARFWAQNRDALQVFRADPAAALAGNPAFDRQAYGRAFSQVLSQRIKELQGQA